MRGQLVDAPGYMMNYAVGAILIAAIRERIRTRHGRSTAAIRLVRLGGAATLPLRRSSGRPARSSRQFLGGPVSPAAPC